MKKYRGASGKIYTINPEPIAKGGEGTICAVEGADDIVAKVYKQEKRTKRRLEKLSLMIRYQLTDIQRKQVTWPLDVIYEESGFAGYIMPRLHSAEDFTVVCGAGIEEINLEDRLFIGYNICAAVDTVHSFGKVCGDLNPQNICVNLDTSDPAEALMVTLVDTDSYHIVNGQMMYRCEVGQANYIPPELQKRLYGGQSLSSMPLPTYSKETDRFALAVNLFSLFMNGCHPFACAIDPEEADTIDESLDIPQPSDNIRKGFSPFFYKKKGITYPTYAPDFTFLPESFQRLFYRTFVDGYKDPTVRASASEWMQVIMEVLQNKDYIKCPNGHIFFINKKVECPYCEMIRKHQERQRKAQAEAAAEARRIAASQPIHPKEHMAENYMDTRPKEPSFIESHLVFIVYGVIILFIVLFVVWYFNS